MGKNDSSSMNLSKLSHFNDSEIDLTLLYSILKIKKWIFFLFRKLCVL